MKKIALIIAVILLIPILTGAQTMRVKLNDLGPTPGSPGTEVYRIHIYEIEVQGVTSISITSGSDQYTFVDNSSFPNGFWDVNFIANVPMDVFAKIYRVKFKIERRLYAFPYTLIARGDPDYSEWCNTDMFYSVSGFAGYGDLN